jgi:tetratricopeptide (TPR) repeat protein
MWSPWRLTLRKAEHALKVGQLDEALGYVTRREVQSYRQTRDLAVRVGQALAMRAEKHLRQGDSRRAWVDIEAAEQLNGSIEQIGRLRQELVRCGLHEAAEFLKAGQPVPALEALERLAKHGASSPEIRRLHDAATAWRAAVEQARAGRLAQALEQFDKARGLLPDCEPLEHATQAAWAARDRLAELQSQLHRALDAKDWSAALAVADEMLGLAPEHVQARAARRRAWQAVGAPVSGIAAGRHAMVADFRKDQPEGPTVVRGPGSPLADAAGPPAPRETPDDTDHGGRFLLWIDGVGGYLVCLGARVSLGQPAGWHVDVPIMADLSRLHAWIERDGEGYLLRSARAAAVNGRSVQEKAVLADNAEIVLGQAVRLRFRQSSPLSATARLELASSHRLSVPADAVLLMSDTCIIGPTAASHVVARGWNRDVVLYRQGDELWCRTAGDFSIDDVACHDRGRLTLSSRIKGDGFSLALEPVGS